MLTGMAGRHVYIQVVSLCILYCVNLMFHVCVCVVELLEHLCMGVGWLWMSVVRNSCMRLIRILLCLWPVSLCLGWLFFSLWLVGATVCEQGKKKKKNLLIII